MGTFLSMYPPPPSTSQAESGRESRSVNGVEALTETADARANAAAAFGGTSTRGSGGCCGSRLWRYEHQRERPLPRPLKHGSGRVAHGLFTMSRIQCFAVLASPPTGSQPESLAIVDSAPFGTPTSPSGLPSVE